MQLTKHHGLGNDFLVTWHIADADPVVLARHLCDRRRGVGADGLLIGARARDHDARMVLFNADGSRAEMSGNGIRCFSQALARRAGDLRDQTILTDAGTRHVRLAPTDDVATVMASVGMGEVGQLTEPDGWASLGAHPDRPVAHLSMGNPHSVVGVDEVGVVDLAQLGGMIPHVNLEIIEPGPEPHAITMRVHERGVGITEACGTGACAAAFAARSWGLVTPSEPAVTVHMDGGTAQVRFDGAVAELTGPATHVADVEVNA
jgi:diaminopimelate epimerase